MFCSSCGAEIGSSNCFCSQCGRPVAGTSHSTVDSGTSTNAKVTSLNVSVLFPARPGKTAVVSRICPSAKTQSSALRTPRYQDTSGLVPSCLETLWDHSRSVSKIVPHYWRSITDERKI